MISISSVSSPFGRLDTKARAEVTPRTSEDQVDPRRGYLRREPTPPLDALRRPLPRQVGHLVVPSAEGASAATVNAMARVLVTGMSGVGKTTLLDELRRRGHLTVDTDYDGWELPDRTWDERRMDRLLARHPDVIVSGTVENQARFYDRFEHVVLLSAPVDVLLERVSTRSNNPYGKTPEQRAEIASYMQTVEPLLRRGATLQLDGQRPTPELADAIEWLVTGTS